jgi:hypothetical protein
MYRVALILIGFIGLLQGCAHYYEYAAELDCRGEALGVAHIIRDRHPQGVEFAWGPSIDPRYAHVQACSKPDARGCRVYYELHHGRAILRSSEPSPLFANPNNIAYIREETLKRLN